MNSYLRAERINHGFELDFDSFETNKYKKGTMEPKTKTKRIMEEQDVRPPKNVGVGISNPYYDTGGSSPKPILEVKLIKEHAILPTRGSEQSAGLDLYSIEDVTIFPGESVGIHTGISIAVPGNHFGAIHPRSGLALKNQIGIVNAPGTIDSDYRGEVIVLLENRGRETFKVNKGDRIAQLLIIPCVLVNAVEVKELSETNRGTNGFGSTGR